jgi:hypothetical protein
MEAIPSSETLGLTRATLHHIPEKTFFIVTAVKTLKSYITSSMSKDMPRTAVICFDLLGF